MADHAHPSFPSRHYRFSVASSLWSTLLLSAGSRPPARGRNRIRLQFAGAPKRRRCCPPLRTRETKGVPLGTEHAADQALRVLRHPMAPHVRPDFEMVRSDCGLRRKVGHAGPANTVIPVAPTRSLILLA